MSTQLGKNFIVTLMAVVLALGGLTWLSERTQTKDVPQVAAMPEASQQAPTNASPASQLHQDTGAYTISDTARATRDGAAADSADSTKTSYDEGYRTGYQDGERDCQQSHATARASARPATHYYSGRSNRRYYSSRSYARSGVAGVAYAAPHRGHSTRNMILTVAAPAALAAGIGGIAGGGKGAGIGALIGGGGGALYYLLKHRNQ